MISRIVFAVVAICGLFPSLAAPAPPPGKGLTILYSADERGEIEPCG